MFSVFDLCRTASISCLLLVIRRTRVPRAIYSLLIYCQLQRAGAMSGPPADIVVSVTRQVMLIKVRYTQLSLVTCILTAMSPF